MPRAKASVKPVSERGQHRRQDDPAEDLPRTRAQRLGGVLEVALHLDQRRLHGAHDERQADQDQRDDDSDPGVGHLDAEARELQPEPAVRREHRGERDAGHRGRQRERQVDQRVDQPAARELVAHERPGDDEAEERIDDRGEQRGAEAQAIGSDRARIQQDLLELGEARRAALDDQRREREQHDRAQEERGEAERKPEPGQDARLPEPAHVGRARTISTGSPPRASSSVASGRSRCQASAGAKRQADDQERGVLSRELACSIRSPSPRNGAPYARRDRAPQRPRSGRRAGAEAACARSPSGSSCGWMSSNTASAGRLRSRLDATAIVGRSAASETAWITTRVGHGPLRIETQHLRGAMAQQPFDPGRAAGAGLDRGDARRRKGACRLAVRRLTERGLDAMVDAGVHAGRKRLQQRRAAAMRAQSSSVVATTLKLETGVGSTWMRRAPSAMR